MSEAAIMLLISILGALGTLVGTVWTVRGMLGRFEVKLAVIENELGHGRTTMKRHSEKIEQIEEAVVGRNGRAKPA